MSSWVTPFNQFTNPREKPGVMCCTIRIGIVQSAGSFGTGLNMNIGRATGPGIYTISGGALAVGTRPANPAAHEDRDLIIGADAATTGVLNQSGGTVTVAGKPAAKMFWCASSDPAAKAG